MMVRGTLNGTKTALTTSTFGQCWTLDATGNWTGFREEATEAADRSGREKAEGGSRASGGTWDLVQSRTANKVNEITGVTNSTGAAGWQGGPDIALDVWVAQQQEDGV